MINISKPILQEEEIEAVVAVLKSGTIVQGPKTAEFEQAFAKYCGVKYAVAFNSGTAAIHAGLYALGIGPGDEVITSPFTFVASANPILMQGAKVVFADISEEDFNIDPKDVEKRITERTRALLPIDLYGQIHDYGSLLALAKKKNLKILEDACQAVGAEYRGVKAGNFGDVGAFSLYATKNIMCGEGGMLTTNEESVMEKAKQFRHHGQSEKTRYEYWDIGYNYRMTDINAAIGIEQLKKIEKFNAQRKANAEKYFEGLSGIKGLVLPEVKNDKNHVFHQFTIRITQDFRRTRDELLAFLKEKGIVCGVYYPKPLHLHPHFMKMGYKEGDFPVAERMSKQVLSLPVHPSLSDQEIVFVIDAIKEYSY
jgi:perosamine synthetase